MLTPVENLAIGIRRSRTALGLSIRELATLAQIAYPTISRIEQGRENPRWSTICRIAAALGEEVGLGGSEKTRVVKLADLTDAWSKDHSGADQPNWTNLRAFADQLALHPELSGAAIMPAPLPSGSLFFDNLLAGIAEKSADDIGIKRPKWARRVRPLPSSWESMGTPRMRAANEAKVPPQLKQRNILIPAAAIWRDRELVPA
jgi:transcriptional regulator with XRE-family HTH domain